MKEIILYHTKEEMNQTRALYEQAFPEDSKEFISYYYEYKCRDNAGYVIVENEQIISMMHLNPYRIQWKCGKIWKTLQIFYIVAVATEEIYRRQGYMNALMEQMMAQCRNMNIPYIVLLPVNPAIYEPFGFVTVGTSIRKIPKEGLIQEHLRIQPEEFQELVQLSNHLLRCKYDYYVERSEDYYKRLDRELSSQQGGMYWIKENEKVIGYCFYESVDGIIQEIECMSEYPDENFYIECNTEKEQYGLMARILSLETMMENVSLKENASEQKLAFTLIVENGQQEQHKEEYCWNIYKDKSTCIPRHLCKREECLVLHSSIEQMTQFLFGYKKAADIFSLAGEQVLAKLEQVCVRENISFREVV